MKIYYITGNKGKIKLANLIFKDMDIEIVQEDMETPEIQTLDCEEVSKYSAKYACEKLNKAVLKNDSGLWIDSLNGFPGALAKYCEDTIRAEGFINLLKGKERTCHWVEVLSYCEPGKEPVPFTSITPGTIAETIHIGRGDEYDKIFIPENSNVTFSEMSEEEQLKCFDNSAYLKLFDYLANKN